MAQFTQADLLQVTTCLESNPKALLEDLLTANPSVAFVRFQWVDYAGIVRAKSLMVESCRSLLAEDNFVRLPPMALHCAIDSTLLPGTDYPGTHWLVPDWSSLRLSSNPKALILMCGVYCGPTPYSLNSKWDLCPRGALVRQIQRAEDEWGLKFLVGFEVEFQVMKQADRSWDGMLPLSIGLGHFATAGMLDPCWTVVEDCAEKLRSMGVRVASLHPEGLRGQYEIALSPSSPLQAVDELMLVRSVLKETFHSRGGTATLSPKPMAAGGQQMNGQHMHISIQHTNSDQEEWFLAGILKRLPNLWAILLAQKASYDRVAPWMAGDRIAWGTENRTVPIRRIRPNHWEIRGMDATANVYLALAAVLSAGLIGISNKEPLTWPDASSSKADIQGDPLPRSLSESLVKLEDNSCGLDQMLGERLVRHYIDLKRYELSQMEDMGSEKARNLLIEVF